ncbi:hypothetical protein C9374_008889 [Naegleria lovaniensis]|uniref:Uncharacterized protein n=1 Tax=Naegleria lovaniensis TaxID=51637 RepID=A0AA88KKH2_NAELO|nr:uncharacterized protein C9374_008889 [Naegleria lovaniensis]KAG2377804.1 hypothetical protein C9374_008889 [Naegleria lovaniensis]
MYSSSDDDDEYEEDELSHPSDGEYEVVDIGDDEDSCETEDDLQQDEEEDPCESSIHLPLPTFETQFILDHHKSIQSNTKHTLLSFEECSGGYYHRENTSRESQVDKTNLKLLEDLFFNPSSLGDNDSEYKQFVNHAIENKLLYYYLLVVLCGNIGLGVLNN